MKIKTSIVAAFFICFYACSSPSTETGKTSKDSISAEKPEVASNWDYMEEPDKMTGEMQYFAKSTSTTPLEFEFPYQGGSECSLILRKKGEVTEVLMHINKGQFMPSLMGHEKMRIKFNDGKVTDYYYQSPDNIDTQFIFITDTKKFLTELKSSSKLTIEVPFFSAGRKVVDFKVDGVDEKFL